jgi:putative FmdB family regulatory protein
MGFCSFKTSKYILLILYFIQKYDRIKEYHHKRFQPMPLYEYQCNECQHQEEVLEKINSAKVKQCPLCGKSTFTKKISAVRFKLKGTGWYETDFKPPKGQTDSNSTTQSDTSTNPAAKESTDSKKGNNESTTKDD